MAFYDYGVNFFHGVSVVFAGISQAEGQILKDHTSQSFCGTLKLFKFSSINAICLFFRQVYIT